VIGITSRALFDLDKANDVFRTEGLAAYRAYQRKNEDVPLSAGTGLPLVRGLLGINEQGQGRLVEVIVISRNDADSGMRIFNSIAHHGLDISRGAFTDGRDASVYLEPFHCDLFLSAEQADVTHALEMRFPAALVCTPPEAIDDQVATEVRVAFDGDAVLFDDESERVFQEQGLDAFLEREAKLADQPMNPGPFKPFLMGLKLIQEHFSDERPPIRTALVTARNAPAHKRVVNTLRAWGVRVDETFFLGGIDKARVLAVLHPHIYFDDQMSHLEGARVRTPSAQVIPVGKQIPLPFAEAVVVRPADGKPSAPAEKTQETSFPAFADRIFKQTQKPARIRRKAKPVVVKSDETEDIASDQAMTEGA